MLVCTSDNASEQFERSGWTQAYVHDNTQGLVVRRRGSRIENAGALRAALGVLRAENVLAEDQVFLSQAIALQQNTQLRFFCVGPKVLPQPVDTAESILFLAKHAATVLSDVSPFFALDIAVDQQGKAWVLDVSDGQVSDLRHPWHAEHILDIAQALHE